MADIIERNGRVRSVDLSRAKFTIETENGGVLEASTTSFFAIPTRFPREGEDVTVLFQSGEILAVRMEPRRAQNQPVVEVPQGAPSGIYDHFKGGVYLVTGLSSWASGNGETVVEYLSLIFGKKHTRFLTQWNEEVAWPDGATRPRFVYRGLDLTVPPPPFKVPSPDPLKAR